jgi:YaiO family outer membrane protein
MRRPPRAPALRPPRQLLIAAALSGAVLAAAAPARADPYAEGVAARQAGRTAEAVRLLKAATEAAPRDADAWLQYGLALSAARRWAEADAALARAEALAPEYRDVRLARARLAWFRGDRAEAERRLGDPALAGDPEAASLLARIRSAPADDAAARWRMDVAASHSALSRGLDPWRAVAVSFGRRLEDGATVTAGVEWTRRFGREDVYFELRGDRRLGDWSVWAAAGGAPDADHRPEWVLKGGATGPSLGGGVRPTLEAALLSVPAGRVTTVQPGLVLERGRASLSGRAIGVWDETGAFRSGWAVRGGLDAAERLRLELGYADAPETSEGVTVDVRALNGAAIWRVGPRTALRLDVTRETRAAFDRTEVSLGVSRRF